MFINHWYVAIEVNFDNNPANVQYECHKLNNVGTVLVINSMWVKLNPVIAHNFLKH